MHLVCLCPTYGRPSLVANALALFLRQQLRWGDTARLLIFDDAGQIAPQSDREGRLAWTVMSQRDWIPLTRKYAPMLGHDDARVHMGRSEAAFVVWDDDDVYLPHHLASHASALERYQWSHPSRAWSTYGIDSLREPPREKRLNGRHYHGALAVRADLMAKLSGWPKTDRSNYDKQMLASCWNAAGPPGDPCAAAPPSYVYRWADTGRDHCSARIRDGRYQPPRIQEFGTVAKLHPQLDASADALLARLV